MSGVEQRLWDKIEVTDGCWLWTGSVDRYGYGAAWDTTTQKKVKAHRIVFSQLVRRLEQLEELDHVCHTTDSSCVGGSSCLHRRCVKPAHLEIVDRSTQIKRSVQGFDHERRMCRAGLHDVSSPESWKPSHGGRECLECARERSRRNYRKKRVALDMG